MLTWRGFLLHLTHYDPRWLKTKAVERRYHKPTALAVIRAMAESGFNMLVIDIKDAVRYRSLPDIRRPYTVPMSELRELTALAKELGLEVVPKMNFSRSPHHRHSAWFEPQQADPDSERFWKRGWSAVDEVLDVVQPRILHVGMDEDDTRSPQEYLRALQRLHAGCKKRGLRMAMWADVCHRWRPQQRWKEIPAIRRIPRDVILMPWDYSRAQDGWIRRFRRWGFKDVFGVCNYHKDSKDPLANAKDWLRAVRKNGGSGILVTKWIPTSRANRPFLLEIVRRAGALLGLG